MFFNKKQEPENNDGKWTAQGRNLKPDEIKEAQDMLARIATSQKEGGFILMCEQKPPKAEDEGVDKMSGMTYVHSLSKDELLGIITRSLKLSHADLMILTLRNMNGDLGRGIQDMTKGADGSIPSPFQFGE